MTNKVLLLSVLLAIVSLGALTEAASSSDGEATDLARLPVPEAAALVEASKLIADVYKDDIAGATKPEQKTALATKLLATEAPAEKNPARRYALYVMARDTATDAGDSDTPPWDCRQTQYPPPSTPTSRRAKGFIPPSA